MQVLVLSAAAEREPRFDFDLAASRNRLNYARLQSTNAAMGKTKISGHCETLRNGQSRLL